MAEIKITQADLRVAEDFLVEYLSEKIPEASFAKGSAMRDFVISAFTYIFAYLKYEVDFSRVRQSLLRISELSDTEDIAQAADEILSNWFITRKGGQYARVTARLHFTERRPYKIPRGSRFWRDSTRAFYIDTDEDFYVVPEDSLSPLFDRTGGLVDYVTEVPLVAVFPGARYSNIEPGTFASADFTSPVPFFAYAEHLMPSSGGEDVESTAALLERAQTAISVRNLINGRSCDVVLQDTFPEIIKTLTLGMGDTEMVRDLRTEIAGHIRLHIGGHYDTYVDLPLVTVEETGVVGGYFARPDGITSILRDPALTYDAGETFVTVLGVTVGDVIYVVSGITGVPRGFQVVAASDHELEVSVAIPFPEATDETGNVLQYIVGELGPHFTDKVGLRSAAVSVNPLYEHIPAGTSRHIQSPGCIVLSGRPVQNVEWVEVMDPTGPMALMVDPTTGTIIFPLRVNHIPVGPMAEASLCQYRVSVRNPAWAQSGKTVTLIDLGLESDATYFNGRTLRVRYQTLAGFRNVHTFVEDSNRRVVSANYLVRARHPVWIEATLPYKMKVTLADAAIDEDEAARVISDYINAFDPDDDLDMSDLATVLRNAYPNIGVVYPFIIYYRLQAPDGQEVVFATEDAVSIFMSDENKVTVENADELIVPPVLAAQGITALDNADALKEWYALYGITDRTIKFRCVATDISFLRKG